MKEETTKASIIATSAPELIEQLQRLPYHTPMLLHYGGLVELVQRNPGIGTDGGAGDCSHS